MRNFKKVMALAISVAAICSSVSAFAELDYTYDGDLTGIATYTADGHTLTLDVAGAAGDKTVLVLDNGVEDTAATGDDILYINQYTESETAYDKMGLKGEALEAGTYVVKFGYTDANGDFAIAEGTIIVAEKQPEQQYVLIDKWGDIDTNGEVSGLDAAKLINVVLGGTENTTYTINVYVPETEILWGDIDTNGEVSGLDAAKLINVVLGGTENTTYTIDQPAQLPKVSK